MDMLALTMRWDRRMSRVITPVMVQQAESFCVQRSYPVKRPVELCALWDTGSERTCISAKMVQALGLKPTADFLTVSSVHGSESAKMYMLDVVLPDKIRVANVLAPAIDIKNDFDLIIGMNIISMGLFVLANENGNTALYFKLPIENPL
jgi:hypothetical protein